MLCSAKRLLAQGILRPLAWNVSSPAGPAALSASAAVLSLPVLFTPAAFYLRRCGPPASVHRRVLRFLPVQPFTRVRLRILTTA